jgi:hypothetical protein
MGTAAHGVEVFLEDLSTVVLATPHGEMAGLMGVDSSTTNKVISTIIKLPNNVFDFDQPSIADRSRDHYLFRSIFPATGAA